jgi:protein-arginine deiminase
VNLQTFDGVALVPKPFGPVIDGEDVFERVTRERLEALELDVRFVDSWNLYHLGLGEIHCGTQADRTIPRDAAWWEMDR